MAVITSLQRAVSSRHGSASYSKDLTCVCGWVGTACCSLSHVRGAFKRIHMYQPRQLEAFDAQRKSTTLRLERSLRSCRFMNRCVATHSGAHSHYQAPCLSLGWPYQATDDGCLSDGSYASTGLGTYTGSVTVTEPVCLQPLSSVMNRHLTATSNVLGVR